MSDPQSAPTTDELLAHAGWLQRLAERLVGAGEKAEDLVQDTWLAALRHGPRRGKSLRPWLATVLRNFAISSARGRARRRWREEQHALPEALPSTAELTARAEASRALVEAVLDLSEDQRVVVLLRYFEQLPTPEIAARLGYPVSTVRSHLSRGIERLRVQLDRHADGDRESWVRCLTPLSTAIPLAQPLIGILLMANATKFTAAALIVGVVGLGIWSMQAESPATLPGTAALPAVDAAELSEAEVLVAGTEQAAERRDAVEAAAAPDSEAGPVRGVLLDSVSGAPVPWFALGIAPGPAPLKIDINAPPVTHERVVTDAEGRFRSIESFDRDDAHLILLEDWERFNFRMSGTSLPRPAVAFDHDPRASEWATVSVECGPAYLLDCPQAVAIGVTEFAAVLTHSESLTSGLRTSTHVAGDPVVLARFLPMDRDLRRAKLDTLHLISLDGLWAGWARVHVQPGLAAVPVSIDLSPCGNLQVKVRAASSPPLESAFLAIFSGAHDATALEAREPIGEFMASNSMMLGGSRSAPRRLAFHHRHLPVGSYTLRVRSTGCADHVEQVEVRQGDREIEAVLERNAPMTGRITGRVIPRSGKRPDMECIAWSQLTEDDASLSQRNTPLHWTEVNGKWSATFAFEDLLEAEYRVWITPGIDVSRDLPAPSCEPRDHRTLPDGQALEFELIEPPSGVQLEVHAIDGATGEPLAEFQAMAWLPKTGKEPNPVEGADGHALVELRGDKEGGRLLVSAKGYAPIFTDLPASPDADGKWRTTLRLDPGWGAPVQVVIFAGDERDPAAGVEVLADDQVVATTDEMGVAWLSLATRPKRLHVRGAGLILESTSGSLDDAGLLEEEPLEPMRETFFFRMRRER